MIKHFSYLILYGILLSWSFPNLSDASYSSPPDTHTHTSAIELKPASLEGSYQTASVCFLGDTREECAQMGFNKGNEDYNMDTAKQCMNEGYVKNNCTSVQDVTSYCPYNKGYIKGCKCKTSLISCTTPKFGVGASCGGKYASCQCPETVSLTNINDRCTQTCDGNCIAKTCSPDASESGCQYGMQSCSNGCGGTRSCCKACYPSSDDTGCSYGTYSCSDGCGGTRRCCASCSPSRDDSGCSYGTYSCSDGCGGTRKCCSPAPKPPANPWKYAREMTGDKYCYGSSSSYTIQCEAGMYCINSSTGEKNYICRKVYGLGKTCRSNNWDTPFSSLEECKAAISSCSCSGDIGDDSNMGSCDSSGNHSCSY